MENLTNENNRVLSIKMMLKLSFVHKITSRGNFEYELALFV